MAKTVISQPQSEHMGIGTALARTRLRVPPNQREYAWEEEHVQDLFQDLARAIDQNKTSYFLGTIVLTAGQGDTKEVADGQQRLATITILLCGIRDRYRSSGDEKRATAIEQKFLWEIDLATANTVPRLTLNVDDNTFFQAHVLRKERAGPVRVSHKRIEKAVELAERHIESILAQHGSDYHKTILLKWTEFIENHAHVILLSVPDDLNAFVMFETLNDRGLKTSQADLVKNYLFREADNRLSEAQNKWSQMKGVLESLDDEDIIISYLRHLLLAKYEPTRTREVFERVEKLTAGERGVMAFLDDLANTAADYVAIQSPDHAKWNEYDTSIRSALRTLQTLGVVVVRPLLLSVVQAFQPQDAVKATKLILSWSVRFLIVGGGRSGSVEEKYSELAVEVTKKRIATVDDMARNAEQFVPSDVVFEAGFASATVSQARLARYYLRALEVTSNGTPDLEVLPNEDESIVNLEHVLPEKPEDNWPSIDPELQRALYRRIGNMCLLRARVNSDLKSGGFQKKKQAYADSKFQLTREVANHADWGQDEINQRQKKLASLAVKTWPLNVY